MTLGLCVNARGCWPLPSEVYELGLLGSGWVRSIVYSLDEFASALQTLPTNVRVCALLNAETAGYQDWDQLVLAFARRFKDRVQAVECLNEADLLGIPASVAVDHLVRAKGPLLLFGMRPILTSVAGPDWQGYLSQCRTLLGVDALGCWCALHPYGQRANGYPAGWGFGELDAAIRRANELSGMPVAVTEWGIKVRDAGGEEQQARYIARAGDVFAALPSNVLTFASLFCLGDEMGSPGEQGQDGFGLRRLGGSHRPAWDTFARVNGGPIPAPSPTPTPPPPTPQPTPAPPHYVLGFELFHNAAPELLGEPLENERGGIPGFSQQRTSRGILTAANIVDRGWELLFWETQTGDRYRFADGRAELIA
jgi:hypothetical protein